MEIVTHPKSGYKLKAKTGSVIVDTTGIIIEGDKPFRITSPGEYEVGGVSVIGVADPAGKIYVIELDSLRVCYLENVTTKLTSPIIAEIGPIDIVVVSAIVPEIISQIDPSVIVAEKGAEIAAVAKYAVTLDKLPTETQTVILERKD